MSEQEEFPCGHKNYGTPAFPASCYGGWSDSAPCAFCGVYYCADCNYDTHICGGCGENYRHGRYAIDHPVSCTD